MTDEPEFAFGTLSADRPDAAKLNRKRFRIALMGDFSGRSARGLIETGDALAARKGVMLDVDTVEDVIESFATTLVLPIGKDEAGIEVTLKELDDLHPDELYEKVELFDALNSLKSQLTSGATAANAAKQLTEWGETFGQKVKPPKSRSGGNAVPADLRLSDFQTLIGDTKPRAQEASPVDDLIARVVGPHIKAIPSADQMAMQGAVDEALSSAMRLVLHHPEFQSIEAQWRSLDMIARNIETDDTLDVVLYDISAEEIAADLATATDLTESGVMRLLTEDPLDEENGRGGFSALIGMYTFEETPPHAEILGRIGRVAAHLDAPFFSAITPAFLDTAKEDRHPLVAEAWDTLRGMPEAGHLGVVSPRFLLRRPYGQKTEPIYEFDFEEFTPQEGLSGMLWANPVVLIAILLAKSFKTHGKAMQLGKIMSMGEMPYHFVTDRFGDQVQLPCTERNLTLETTEKVMVRGYMPVVSMKGRDEVRLASFQSLGGSEILGPWTGVEPPPPSPPKPKPAAADEAAEDLDLDDLDLGSDDDGDLGDLDDLLAGFGDDDDADDADDDDMDAELAALLEGL
nr:type VI secretion system contractile sheath large subunit [Actibacterium pelagium]